MWLVHPHIILVYGQSNSVYFFLLTHIQMLKMEKYDVTAFLEKYFLHQHRYYTFYIKDWGMYTKEICDLKISRDKFRTPQTKKNVYDQKTEPTFMESPLGLRNFPNAKVRYTKEQFYHHLSIYIGDGLHVIILCSNHYFPCNIF